MSEKFGLIVTMKFFHMNGFMLLRGSIVSDNYYGAFEKCEAIG